mgnify:CR=1 FL=1
MKNSLVAHAFGAAYATGGAQGLRAHISYDGFPVALFASDVATIASNREGYTRLSPTGVFSEYALPVPNALYTIHVMAEDGRVLTTARGVVATPSMESQTWLPFLDKSGCCHNILAIAAHTFAYSDTSATVGADTYSIRPVTYMPVTTDRGRSSDVRHYMAAVVNDADTRRRYDSMKAMEINASFSSWRQPAGTSYLISNPGTMAAFFLKSAALNTPVVYVPPTASNATRTWAVNAPFSNAPACQFIDVNWLQETQAAFPSFDALSVSIGTATSDPGAGAALKPFLVSTVTPAIVNDTGVFSTIRVVRITKAAVPTGTYTWPLTLTNKGGQSITVSLTVTAV